LTLESSLMEILRSPITLVMILTIPVALIWIAAILLRVYRLARFFQLEGYESKRYFRWISRQKREQRYILGTVAALLFLLIPVFTDFALYKPFVSGPGRAPIGVVHSVVALVLGIIMLVTLPRDKQVNQKFARTPRAMRLVVTALILGILLPAYYVIVLAINWIGRQPLDMASVAFFNSTTSAIGLILSAVMLPLANIVMWPVEESVRRKFMRMAKATLKRSGATVICITGSYGKTSTKHYLQHILSARYRTLMTPKSFNTLMGISRAINTTLATDPNYEYFIVEADAYFVGENASICRLVEPKIGMVMTVGPMHLERLGTMENIATAQYEIIASLPKDGAGIFNGDDPLVRAMIERNHPQTRLMVTQKGVPGARLEAQQVRMEADGAHFHVLDHETGAQADFYAPLYGETNVTNILMASVVAVYLGLSLEEIAGQVATLQPAEHRLVRRVLPDGTVVIDDAYSANPVGTKAALEVLALHTSSRHRIVISSGMFELGTASEQENHLLGERMAKAATDVILIGQKQAEPVKAGLLAQQFPADRLHVVNSLDEAITIYRGILQSGDTLLMLTDLPDTYAA